MKHTLILMIVVLLAACGGAPQGEAETEGDPTAEVVATTAPTAEIGEDEFVEIGPDDPIRVAVVGSNSGEALAEIGKNQYRFAQLAAEDFGTLFGRDVELVQLDGMCSADGGRRAATDVVNDESYVAVVGHSCSSSCETGAAIYAEAGYTMVSSSCTAPALTNPETHQPSFLRTVFNDLGQGAVAAQFVYDDGVREVALVDDGSTYATGLTSVFRTNFEALGGTIVYEGRISVGSDDATNLLTNLAAESPELIYMPIFPDEGALIANQRTEIPGITDIPLMGADGLTLGGYVEQAGDNAEGTLVTGPATPNNDAYLSVEDAYLVAYGEEPTDPFGANAYDATSIILNAIADIGVEREDGTLLVGRGALNTRLYDTDNYEGLIGAITCDEFGDCGFAVAIAVSQIEDGEYVELR
jgi:branched-chain amino acid transport system substrate-binding protein